MFYDDRYDDKLMKMTPNVKTLQVLNSCDDPPSMNFHDISIYLPKLDNLRWQMYGKSQHDLQSSCDVDAMITGYSKTFCKVKSAEFREKDYLTQQEVTSYGPYRRYSALVDLKGTDFGISFRFRLCSQFDRCTELRHFQMHINLERDSYKKHSKKNDKSRRDNAGFDRRSDWYQSSLTKATHHDQKLNFFSLNFSPVTFRIFKISFIFLIYLFTQMFTQHFFYIKINNFIKII